MIPDPKPFVFRFIDPNRRLTIATLIAIAVYALTFALETGLRVSLAYDVAVAAFLTLHAYRINRITAQGIQNYYQNRQPSNGFVVMTALVFSILSMVGVGIMADISKKWTPLQQNLQEPATECNGSLILSSSDQGCGRRCVGPAIAGQLAQTEAIT